MEYNKTKPKPSLNTDLYSFISSKLSSQSQKLPKINPNNIPKFNNLPKTQSFNTFRSPPTKLKSQKHKNNNNQSSAPLLQASRINKASIPRNKYSHIAFQRNKHTNNI
ncbi:hypothetical protein BB558_007257, partial [Smittium angustum]